MVGMERPEQDRKVISARDMGLVCCRRCTGIWPAETKRCGRCGKKLVVRDWHSLQRVWALLLVGLMCYIPANLYPMRRTRTLLSVQQDTIIGGAISFIEYGSYFVAAVILVASVVIPLAKFLAIGFLAISVTRPSSVSAHQRQLLYEVVEYIGRWSMIDIFVVAIMSSLVQLNTLVAVQPGIASLFFALSVIFTMLAAQAFDSRLIWDAGVTRERAQSDE